jgi:uncharacterized protein (TIGR00369 family)
MDARSDRINDGAGIRLKRGLGGNTLTLEEMNAFLQQSPLHQWLDCSIVSHDPDTSEIKLRLPDRPELRRGGEAVSHGGVIAAFIDIAAHAALYAQTGHGIPTIDLRVDYLRLASLPLTARAVVRRNGRTIGVADVEIFDRDEKLAAIGRVAFLTR